MRQRREEESSTSEWAEVVRAFLEDPPPGTPRAVLEALGAGGGALPPRLFYEAVEQSAVAISITDLRADILYANPAFERVTGYGRDEVIGHNEAILSDKQTPSRVYEEMWQQLLDHEPWLGVLINRTKEGRRYLADITIAPVLGPDGKPSHYLGMHRDVTDLHALQQKVRNQKAVLESLLNAAPVVMALLDARGRMMLDNLAYKALAADLRGSEPAEVFLEGVRQQVEDGSEKGDGPPAMNFRGQEVRVDPGGGGETRWFTCSGTWFEERDTGAAEYFEANTESYLLLVADEVTARKRQEEEVRQSALRQLLAEEERAQGMREALSAALFQQEQPLNLIRAAVGLLERRGLEGGKDAELRDILGQALEAGEGARQQLEAAIPETPAGECQWVDLNRLLRELLQVMTERMLAQGVVVDWRPDPVLAARIQGSWARLQLLFKQLLDNALDALEEAPGGQRELRLRTEVGEDQIRVAVADTGPGVPHELRYKVFQPFFTTKGRGRNPAGMGLALAQEVVNEHAGTIEVTEEYGGGACFRVRVPRLPREGRQGG